MEHPLLCQHCNKCFRRRANLALRLKTHLGFRDFLCELCGNRFITRRQKLIEHQNIHTGRAPVKCTECDATFSRFSTMVQHRDRHHRKKFLCDVCGAMFHSLAMLLWHCERHDDRPNIIGDNCIFGNHRQKS